MKKWLILFLTVCTLFSLTACGEDPTESPDIPDEPTEITLEDIEGWWTKPEGFDGVTTLYTFSVDAENGKITSYGEYGTAVAEYPCWYEDGGFSIDADELFGVVTYGYVNDTLVDEYGDIHYVRCDPIDPDDAPYTLEDLYGTWYKEGSREEGTEMLIFDENGYRIEQFGIIMEEGTASVDKHTTYYDSSEYSGPAAELEPTDSMFSSTLWILDNGYVLYDETHEEYYIKDLADDATVAALNYKYAIIRDDWSTEGDSYMYLTFKFFGEVWLYEGDGMGNGETEIIGSWAVEDDGSISFAFKDGASETVIPGDELYLEYCDATFRRWPEW